MLSTIDKFPVSSCVNPDKADFLSDSQDSYAESQNSFEISSDLGIYRSSSPTFGAKSTTRDSKRTCLHDSPTKSPGRLARERLLRKYQRPHVSSPASRKLFVDQQAMENSRVPNLRKRKRGSNDPKMPRLTEISILLERVDYHNTNSSILLRKDDILIPKNKEVVKEKVKLEQALGMKRSDSSGSEDRMPHLHRFSSEEKATDYVDGETSDNDNPTSVCFDKFDGFKQREGLFDILQHEHEKNSPQFNKKKSNSTEKIVKPTNGLVLKKSIFLDVGKISPPKQSNFPVSEMRINRLCKKSHNCDKISSDAAVLDTSKPQTTSHPDNQYEQLSADEKVLILPNKTCDHSRSELSLISDVQPQVPSLKCSPPLCYTEMPIGSVSSHSPILRPKKHHAEAMSFMSDLSELKHDREDQAESYPNSLSSIDDSPDTVTLLVQNLHTNFVNRQLSCPVPTNEDVQIKRNRHMTVSGRTSDLRCQSPAKARERRRRTKTLSHGCSCCMDLGPSRKKRKRFSRSNTKAAWSIPHVLTEEQHTFVDSSTQLISLRHKVFRLCQVLFPKLSHVWQLNADTEQVDKLVNEISGVIKSLKESKSLEQTSKLCQDTDLPQNPDLSLVKQSQQQIENTSEKLVSLPENEGSLKDSKLEDGNLSADSSEKSVFLPVLGSKIPTDNSDLSVYVPDGLSTSDNINTSFKAEATQSKVDNLTCFISVERSADGKLSPLDSCENVKQTSPEDIELGSSDNQIIHSAEKSSCKSICESTQNINNSNSQSCLPLTTSSGAMWGSGTNNQWENEFFQYLSKSTALNKPQKNLLTSKPFKKEANSLTDQTSKTFSCHVGTSTEPDLECETVTFLPKLLDLKVDLCKDPKMCLTQLRWKVIRLLQPLLPNLTLENNFDKFSDDVDMLVDLVTQSNERKILYAIKPECTSHP